mgnify:CR=1 FL=1
MSAVLSAVGRRALPGQIFVRAGALTYYSLLSIVPLLALIFRDGEGARRRRGPPRRPGQMFTVDPTATGIRSSTSFRQCAVGVDRPGLRIAPLPPTACSAASRPPSTASGGSGADANGGGCCRLPERLPGHPVPARRRDGRRRRSSRSGPSSCGFSRSPPSPRDDGQLLRLVPIAFNSSRSRVLYTVMPNRRPNFRAILTARADRRGRAAARCSATYVKFQLAAANWTLLYGALAQIPRRDAVDLLELARRAGLRRARGRRRAEAPSAESSATQSVTPWAAGLAILLRAARASRGGRGPITVEDLASSSAMPRAAVEEVAAAARGVGVPGAGLRDAAERTCSPGSRPGSTSA